MTEILDIINKDDEVIGQASRPEVWEKGLARRIVHIFVFTNDDKLVLNLRGKSVSFAPLHWISSAAGHVLSGETYEQAAHRELQEEIGIDTDIEFKGKYWYKKPKDKFEAADISLGVFHAKHDGPFTPDSDEVDDIKPFTMDEVKDMVLNDGKFHPEFLFLLKEHFNFHHLFISDKG